MKSESFEKGKIYNQVQAKQMEALIRAWLPISSSLTEQLNSCVDSCRAKGLGQLCDG